MGMETLGRTVNVVPIAAGRSLRCDGGSGWTFICTGADTFTLTCADSFAGTFATPGNIIVRKYTNSATNGSAAWVLANQSAANTVVNAGATTTAFYVDNNSLPDGKKYVRVSAGASGLVVAIQGDLTVQRSANNLPALSA